jgi:hypothetical protein
MEKGKPILIKPKIMRKRVFRITLVVIPFALLMVIFLFGSFYTYWNSASPEKTCGSCHEIGKSVEMFAQSPHRDLRCKDCHGTALSNGFHSLKEKGMMVVHHARNKSTEDIKLNEEQILGVMNKCSGCHTSEYANWISGGHSAVYRHIFLNNKHNQTEQINPDCLRCHAMFSDVPIQDVVEPLNKTGPWQLKNIKKLDVPVIPCMTCHLVHKTGNPKFIPDYFNPGNVFYLRHPFEGKVSFYSRVERRNILVQDLPGLQLSEGERPVKVSDDLVMRNCVQCHAPNSHHIAGTSDDRTPRGVHEGLGCTACHLPHSNDARQSCTRCHPAISNCKLDVTIMNTTFADRESPHNIHWVACIDCHKGGAPGRN